MTDVKAQIEALNKNGEVRAWARGPWQIGELIKLLMEWQKADPNRVIHINAIHRAHPPRADLAPTGNAALVERINSLLLEYKLTECHDQDGFAVPLSDALTADEQNTGEREIAGIARMLAAALTTPAAVTAPTEDVGMLVDEADRLLALYEQGHNLTPKHVLKLLRKHLAALAKHKGGAA